MQRCDELEMNGWRSKQVVSGPSCGSILSRLGEGEQAISQHGRLVQRGMIPAASSARPTEDMLALFDDQ